jgi:hypothetical protein
VSQETIRILYDGDALKAGKMDVQELAPALLAMGDLFQQANRSLNGDKTQVSVQVRADFERGSFQVSLDVIQALYEQAKSVLLSDQYTTAKELIALLFGSGSLAGLIKWLRGRKATAVTTLPGGTVKIEINDMHIEVHGDVMRLYNESIVRESMHGVIKPLEKEGVELFEVRHARKILETVKKDEVPYFAPAPFEEPVSESERIAAFEVVTVSFEDKYRWRFTDGNATFTAIIDDEQFFDSVQKRQVYFSKGDYLKVKLHTKTWQTEKGLKTDYRITHVLEVIHSPRQSSLLPPATDQST